MNRLSTRDHSARWTLDWRILPRRSPLVPFAKERAPRPFGRLTCAETRVVGTLPDLGLDLPEPGRLADPSATGHCDDRSVKRRRPRAFNAGGHGCGLLHRARGGRVV